MLPILKREILKQCSWILVLTFSKVFVIISMLILYLYTSHKNNCLNSREMSVFARYKRQKYIERNSSTCENGELRVKKFRLLGIGSVMFRYYASIVLIYIVLYSLKPFFSKRLCIQVSKRM